MSVDRYMVQKRIPRHLQRCVVTKKVENAFKICLNDEGSYLDHIQE